MTKLASRPDIACALAALAPAVAFLAFQNSKMLDEHLIPVLMPLIEGIWFLGPAIWALVFVVIGARRKWWITPFLGLIPVIFHPFTLLVVGCTAYGCDL